MHSKRFVADAGRACALFVLLACGSGYNPAVTRVHKGFGFTVKLTPQVVVNAASPGEGFTLYDFHVLDKQLLFVYVGNHPNIPRFNWAAEPEVETQLSSGLSGSCRIRNTTKGMSRECLFDLGHEFPSQLHAWYENLDPKLQRVADDAIASLAAAPP
jgi:hypothetical protein